MTGVGADTDLRLAQQRLEFHVGNSPLAVIEWDRAFKVARWSGRAEEIFGWAAAEVIGRHPKEWRFVFEQDAEAVDGVMLRLSSGAEQRNVSLNRNYRKDGAVITCRWHNSVLRDDQGNLVSILSLVSDETERVRAQEELEQSEQRYRALVEHSPDAIIVHEAGVILFANPAAARLYGAPAPEDLIGLNVLDLLAPEERGVIAQRVHEVQNLRRATPVRVTEVLRLDGRRVPVEAIGTPVQFAGRQAVQAVLRNISERKEAERRQQLLMQELDHRVKNNLASVSAIADQTLLSTASPEQFVAAFRQRLSAMAAFHEMLACARWGPVNLRELAAHVLAAHVGAHPHRITVDGPDVRVPPRVASVLSLVMNELATNAAKYGALSAPSGRVLIRWSVAPPANAGDAPILELCWQEQDGPPVVPPARRGFGSELIEKSIPYELRGTASQAFHAAGLRFDTRIPLGDL